MGSLASFSAEYLGSSYIPFLTEGNDPSRSVGFLVRKGFRRRGNVVTARVETHAARFIEDQNGSVIRITRDIPALLLREKGQAAPFLIFLGIHYRSLKGYSSESERLRILAQRNYEIFETQRVARHYRELYGQRPFIVLGGDFNSDLREPGELDHLYGEFFNRWDLLAIPLSERFTYLVRPTQERREMDGFLLDPRLLNRIQGGRIVRIPSPDFFNLGLVSAWDDHDFFGPSDHDPVIIDLEIP
jgi:hypothetical protein